VVPEEELPGVRDKKDLTRLKIRPRAKRRQGQFLGEGRQVSILVDYVTAACRSYIRTKITRCCCTNNNLGRVKETSDFNVTIGDGINPRTSAAYFVAWLFQI
jgi:hypothetical protein